MTRLAWFLCAASIVTGCREAPVEPLKLDGNTLTVDNRSPQEWRSVEIWLNTYYRVRIESIPPKGRFQTTLDNFVAGQGQRFQFRKTQVKDLRLTAILPDGKPMEIKKAFVGSGLDVLKPRT